MLAPSGTLQRHPGRAEVSSRHHNCAPRSAGSWPRPIRGRDLSSTGLAAIILACMVSDSAPGSWLRCLSF